MTWIATVLGVVCFVEIIIRLSLITIAIDLARITSKSTAVLSTKRVSDHWKEKVLLKYSILTATKSIHLLLIFLISAIPMIILDFILKMFGKDLQPILVSPAGLIVCTLAGTLYGTLRQYFLTNR